MTTSDDARAAAEEAAKAAEAAAKAAEGSGRGLIRTGALLRTG